MKKTAIVVALISIILGVIASPAVSLNETDTTKKSIQVMKKTPSGHVKSVMIVGLENISFAPNTIKIQRGDTVVFTNVDGKYGGIEHTVTSVKLDTFEHDGKFQWRIKDWQII